METVDVGGTVGIVGDEQVGAGEETAAYRDAGECREVGIVADAGVVANFDAGALALFLPRRQADVAADEDVSANFNTVCPYDFLRRGFDGRVRPPRLETVGHVAGVEIVVEGREGGPCGIGQDESEDAA